MNRKVYVVAFLLIVAGAGIFTARIQQTKPKFMPERTPPSWEVEARAVIDGAPSSVRTTTTIPPTDLGVTAFQEIIRSDGLAAAVFERPGDRQILWTGRPRDSKLVVLSYNVLLERGLEGIRAPKDRVAGVSLEQAFRESEIVKSRKFIAIARRAEKTLPARAAFIRNCVMTGHCLPEDFLKRFRKSEKSRAKALAALLNGAGMRAVVARGFFAKRSKRGAKPRYWVRAQLNNQWLDFFVSRRRAPRPDEMIFWNYVQYGDVQSPDRSKPADVEYSLIPREVKVAPTSSTKEEFPSPFWRFISLHTLPVALQATHQVMLLIPLGALMITLMRSLMGIPTFGTFMPVLIALAFRDTGLGWGLALLSMVIGFGLLVRALLSHLQLLLVPRLSTNLSIVILLVLIISRVSHEMDFARGLSVTLFPIVIITMIIERMSISWEEVGFTKTMILFSTTMCTAVLCYLLMAERLVQYWIFSFPETTLIIIALTLLCGRYTGYRLSEYFRFRTFLKSYETDVPAA